MPGGAWGMMIFGAVVLYGGLAWCLKIAATSNKKVKYVDAECASDLCEVKELEEE